MRRISAYLIFSLVFLGLPASTKAQDILVPAGTLLRCTLDEPNFSSATADIGDPVICHLNGLREFGQNVFPRGSYLGGHLEADKEPGHFVGKGSVSRVRMCPFPAKLSLPRDTKWIGTGTSWGAVTRRGTSWNGSFLRCGRGRS